MFAAKEANKWWLPFSLTARRFLLLWNSQMLNMAAICKVLKEGRWWPRHRFLQIKNSYLIKKKEEEIVIIDNNAMVVLAIIIDVNKVNRFHFVCKWVLFHLVALAAILIVIHVCQQNCDWPLSPLPYPPPQTNQRPQSFIFTSQFFLSI